MTRWLRTRSPAHRVLDLPRLLDRRLFHLNSALNKNALRPQQVVKPVYIDTVPPTPTQLQASEIFFKTHLPTKSWTATEWRQQPHSESKYLVPEVAFLGRSNSGKSSLLNGLLLDPGLCRVGAKPGKTVTMHAWHLSPVDPKTRGARRGYQGDMEPKLTVLDMPGYGHGSHGEWGAAIMKYLTSRRQLRRAFVLVNPSHGLKKQDLQMLELLRGHGISHQMIACKADKIKASEAPVLFNAMQAEIEKYFSGKRQVPVLMTVRDILTIGGLEEKKDKTRWIESAQGLDDVRWAVLRAAGLEAYALALAANGGVPPTSTQVQPRLVSEGTSNDGNTSLNDSEEIRDTLEASSIINVSAEDLSADIFNPMLDQAKDWQPRRTSEHDLFDSQEAISRPSSQHQQRRPSPRHQQSRPQQHQHQQQQRTGSRAPRGSPRNPVTRSASALRPGKPTPKKTPVGRRR